MVTTEQGNKNANRKISQGSYLGTDYRLYSKKRDLEQMPAALLN